jgi:hypothetical protein
MVGSSTLPKTAKRDAPAMGELIVKVSCCDKSGHNRNSDNQHPCLGILRQNFCRPEVATRAARANNNPSDIEAILARGVFEGGDGQVRRYQTRPPEGREGDEQPTNWLGGTADGSPATRAANPIMPEAITALSDGESPNNIHARMTVKTG